MSLSGLFAMQLINVFRYTGVKGNRLSKSTGDSNNSNYCVMVAGKLDTDHQQTF
ncbi:hypothetical protein EXN66_Car021845 [Channa argus]|uniref:Uncharacterized protein n=1 Tax=Channa argus TaxID=215402 RepID=A0A6G1QV21_CHAAH|nr:hypothetical protein EXN66_Car021845 [Channa argus]